MDREEQVTRILNQYKRKHTGDVLHLPPILDADGATIGFLHPITADFKTTMVDCVKLLDQWRMENPTLSPSRFPITHERTERWITNAIIHNDKRILFLVQDLNGQYLGHMGFTSICPEENSAEVDLVVRGVKDAAPGLMGHAMNALVRWGKRELLLEHIELVVLPYNEHAISFYHHCGFQEDGIVPLIKVEKNGEISWKRDKEIVSDPEFYFLHMILY